MIRQKKRVLILDDVLLDDETAKRIRKEFDAYIFLSYRKKDRVLANELMKQIHKNRHFISIAIWYDEYLVPGEKFDTSIQNAMDKSKLFLLLVTPSLFERNDQGDKNYIQTMEYPHAKESNMPVMPVQPILPIEMIQVDRSLLEKEFSGIPEVIESKDEKKLYGVLSDKSL